LTFELVVMSVRPEAIRTLDDGSFTVVSSDREQYPDIPVTTLHLSCASDVYEGPSNKYAGFCSVCPQQTDSVDTQWPKV